jgi:hypothetical protein
MVSKLTIPLLGAVPDHDGELICPVWAGSCGSPVSPIFQPVVLTGRPSRKIRLAKLSFAIIVFLPFFLSGNYFCLACTDACKYICTRIPHSKQKFINALDSLDFSSLCIHHKLLRMFDFFCNESLHLELNN